MEAKCLMYKIIPKSDKNAILNDLKSIYITDEDYNASSDIVKAVNNSYIDTAFIDGKHNINHTKLGSDPIDIKDLKDTDNIINNIISDIVTISNSNIDYIQREDFTEESITIENDIHPLIKEELNLVNSKLADIIYYITPQHFGAKGDGVADDTIPIQNAINSLLSHQTLIGNGLFKITSTLDLTHLPNNTTIIFKGKIIVSVGVDGIRYKANYSRLYIDYIQSRSWEETPKYQTWLGSAIILENPTNCVINIGAIYGFRDGIYFLASIEGIGSQYNKINFQQINQCTNCIRFKKTAAGWINENTIIGGSLRGFNGIVGDGDYKTAGYTTSGTNPSINISDITTPSFRIAVDSDVTFVGVNYKNVVLNPVGLNTGLLIASAMQAAIQLLGGIYSTVTVAFIDEVYVIKSGTIGGASKVAIIRSVTNDVTTSLKLGLNNGGIDTSGTSWTFSDNKFYNIGFEYLLNTGFKAHGFNGTLMMSPRFESGSIVGLHVDEDSSCSHNVYITNQIQINSKLSIKGNCSRFYGSMSGGGGGQPDLKNPLTDIYGFQTISNVNANILMKTNLLDVSSSTSSVELMLPTKRDYNGSTFYVNVSSYVNPITIIRSDGLAVLGASVINATGFWLVIQTSGWWMCSNIGPMLKH
jgi:hypothetical protein